MLTENLQQEVLRLKVQEKIHLIELILESLDHPDLKIQEKWVEESEKRFDAYKAGKVTALSYEQVMKRLEK